MQTNPDLLICCNNLEKEKILDHTHWARDSINLLVGLPLTILATEISSNQNSEQLSAQTGVGAGEELRLHSWSSGKSQEDCTLPPHPQSPAGDLGFIRAYTLHLAWPACLGLGLRSRVRSTQLVSPDGGERGNPKIITMPASLGLDHDFCPSFQSKRETKM